MNEPVITLTESQLKALIKTTVEETLTRFGVEVDKPIEMQADFMHVRSDRLARSAITTKIMLTFIGVLVVGVCATVWLSVKEHLNIS